MDITQALILLFIGMVIGRQLTRMVNSGLFRLSKERNLLTYSLHEANLLSKYEVGCIVLVRDIETKEPIPLPHLAEEILTNMPK